jgi:hypothetical protein
MPGAKLLSSLLTHDSSHLSRSKRHTALHVAWRAVTARAALSGSKHGTPPLAMIKRSALRIKRGHAAH